MEILTAPLQIGTHNVGFSAQFPAKKGPGNLTPNFILVLKLLQNMLGNLCKNEQRGMAEGHMYQGEGLDNSSLGESPNEILLPPPPPILPLPGVLGVSVISMENAQKTLEQVGCQEVRSFFLQHFTRHLGHLIVRSQSATIHRDGQ